MMTSDIAKKYGVTTRTVNNWIKIDNVQVSKNPITNRVIWDDLSVRSIDDFISKKLNMPIEKETEKMSEFEIENRRYLGAKSRMLDFIGKVVVENTKDVNTVADIFGGTGVVANYFYERGMNIVVNDILYSNYLAYQTFFSKEEIDKKKIDYLLAKMNNLEIHDNYVSRNYGNKYFSINNAKKIGEARNFIKNQELNVRERAILLTSLFYAMDKVANTVGHYDAYRKVMDSTTAIIFRRPKITCFSGATEFYHEDANELVKNIKSDLVYVDTPYNSRQYGDVYHVLENVMEWKKPKLFGVAMKPKDRKKTKSDYSTAKAPNAFNDLILNINSRYILVSYNNMAHKGAGRSNAKISNEEIIKILTQRGSVQRFELPFQAYSTGKTHIDDHKEFLYLVEVVK